MDDQPASEVDDPEGLKPPADAPVPMGDGHVDEGRPGDDVDHERLEPDPLREGADDQGRRDCGELQLKGEIEKLGDGVRVSRIGCSSDIVQAEIGEVPNETVE